MSGVRLDGNTMLADEDGVHLISAENMTRNIRSVSHGALCAGLEWHEGT